MEIIQDTEKLLTYSKRKVIDKETGKAHEVIKTIATFILKKLGDGYVATFSDTKREKIDYWLMEYETNGQKFTLNVPTGILTNVQRFKDFFMSYNGIFLGGGGDLSHWVCQLKMETQGIEYYFIQDKYGRYKIGEEDIWVFRNGFFFRETFHEPQQFYYFEKDKRGIKFEHQLMEGYAPKYNNGITPGNITDIIADLSLFFPKRGIIIMLILAFYASTLRYSEFLKILGFNFHFILSVSGRTEVGKTELFTLLNSLIGLEEVQPMAWQATTPHVNQLHIGLNSHFPLWRDEFREVLGGYDVQKKGEFLRTVYNRMPIMKGTKDLGAKIFPIASTLLLTGEDMPLDPAVQRRCIHILMGTEDKVDGKTWGEIKERSATWFRFFHYVVGKKLNPVRIKKTYNNLLEKLLRHTQGATNYAYALTVFLEMFVPETKYEETKETLLKDAIEYLDDASAVVLPENNVEKFFESATAVLSKGIRNQYLKNYVSIVQNGDGKEIRIYMQGLGELLSESERGRNISPKSIRHMLCKDLGGRLEKQRINKTTRHCITVDYEKAPQFLRDLETYLEEEQEAIDAESISNYSNSED